MLSYFAQNEWGEGEKLHHFTCLMFAFNILTFRKSCLLLSPAENSVFYFNFQFDFQNREYDIIGDDAATGLFAVEQNGRIRVSSPLTADGAEQYRVGYLNSKRSQNVMPKKKYFPY